MGIIDKLNLAMKKVKDNIETQESELIPMEIDIPNSDQKIELEGCKVHTNTVHKKSMVKGCKVRITSDRVKQKKQGDDFDVEVDI